MDSKRAFFSRRKGSAQRLPNGNTLIADGENGRTLEVTRRGEIVREFFHPETEDGKRSTFHRTIRYPKNLLDTLLREKRARLDFASSWGS